MWEKIRRWLFPRISKYSFSKQALATMASMAEQTHPKEAFAVLAGRHDKDTLLITELLFQPFSNTERSANVSIDKYTLTNMVGTFHSHPIPNAVPSRADRNLFSRYPGVHCILSYPYTHVHVYNQHAELLGVHAIAYQAAARRR